MQMQKVVMDREVTLVMVQRLQKKGMLATDGQCST